MSERCQNCNEVYETVYQVPDKVWAVVIKEIGLRRANGLLCINCTDKIARDKGIGLYWAAGVNEYPTPRAEFLEAENAVLKNRLDKYDIPDAEIDKALAGIPDLKAKAAAHPNPEIKDALLKINLALEAFAANLKITRQENATLREALGAADEALEYTYKRIAGKNQQVVIEDARALIEAALKGV